MSITPAIFLNGCGCKARGREKKNISRNIYIASYLKRFRDRLFLAKRSNEASADLPHLLSTKNSPATFSARLSLLSPQAVNSSLSVRLARACAGAFVSSAPPDAD